MEELSSFNQKEKPYFSDNSFSKEAQKNHQNDKRNYSPNSSNPEIDFDNLDSEIQLVIENEKELSFLSNSNSKINEQNIDPYLNHKYWETDKNSSSDNDSPNKKIYFKDISLKINKPFHSKYASNIYDDESCNNKSTKSDDNSEKVIEKFISTDSDFFNDSDNNEDNFEKFEKKYENFKESPKKVKKSIEEKVKEKILKDFYSKYNNNSNINNNANSEKNVVKNNISGINGFNLCQSPRNCEQIKYNLPSVNNKNYGNSQFFQRPYIPTNNIFPIISNYKNENDNNIAEINNLKNLNIKKDNEKICLHNKFNSLNEFDFNDKLNKNILLNQNTNPNIFNYNYQKLNPINMLYYPPMQIKPLQNKISQKILNTKNNEKISEIKNNNLKEKEQKTNNLNKGEKQILNLDDIISGKDTRTTVMIRNIPIKYTEEMLFDALKEFNGKYDCLYLPYDFEKNGNKGYAFINFVNPLHILYFYEKFSGKKWVLFESSKICELNVAHFQGINEIQKHAKNIKGFKRPNFYNESEKNNFVIPNKYLEKLLKRYPKMIYVENKNKKCIEVKSFE